uniref:Capsid protein n=1 Tax=viral metagenome TaxID=1070528 RepID=A0A6M3LR48_9ZZZZ
MLVDDYMAVKGLYINETAPKNAGNTKKYNEIDGETYASNKPEGADNSKARVIMGYNKTMTKVRRSKEIDITYEARNENRYPEVVGGLTDLSQFCPQRMALDLTHRLSFCTATSYTDMDGNTVTTTVGDGYALVYSAHTLSSGATTFSNVITGNPQFSPGAFQVARKLTTTEILSHFGERRVMKFDTVVTTDDPVTIDEVRKLQRSTSDPTQNNPGVINPQGNMFKHVVLPRLATTATGAHDSTKDKYWGYVATTGAPQNRWQAYFRIWEQPNMASPAPGNNGEDFHNQNWSFACYVGYGIETVSPRGIFFSTGVGA